MSSSLDAIKAWYTDGRFYSIEFAWYTCRSCDPWHAFDFQMLDKVDLHVYMLCIYTVDLWGIHGNFANKKKKKKNENQKSMCNRIPVDDLWYMHINCASHMHGTALAKTKWLQLFCACHPHSLLASSHLEIKWISKWDLDTWLTTTMKLIKSSNS